MTRSTAVRLPKALIFPASVASTVNAARVRRGYTDAQWKALLCGEVVVTADRRAGGQHAEAAGILEHAASELWPLLVDFESRPSYLPGATEVRIVRVSGNRVWLAEKVKVLFAAIEYRVINTLDPESGSVSWVLDDTVRNGIAATAGSWTLVPLGGTRRRTLLRYDNTLDTGQPLPAAIERMLLKRSLPQMISGMREEAARRFA